MRHPLRHPLRLLPGLLALATVPAATALAADALAAPGIEGYATDSGGMPVRASSGECWRSSRWGPGEQMPASCATDTALGASAVTEMQESGKGWSWPSWTWPSFAALGASQGAASASGSGAPAGIPGYLTDSRSSVVRSGFGDCWHTGSWTPALATVVGCDGVLAKAVPVPAPAPARTAPPEKQAVPPTTAAPAPTPRAEPQAGAAPERAKPASPDTAAPVVPMPAAPAAPSAGLAPDTDGRAGAAPGPRSEKVTLDTDTYFDFDKATLKPDGRRQLEELAARLAGMRLEVVVTTGHTDAIGTQQYNQDLSMRRARAVKAFLEEKGLPVDKIFTTGKGETQPVASNKTREGRAKNRRVEVEVVGIRETR